MTKVRAPRAPAARERGLEEGSTSAIELCLAGRISPQVALARAVLAGDTPESLQKQLARAGGPAAETLRGLLATADITHLQRTAAAYALAHTATNLATLRAAYDRAVAESPEAAVAAYSLGSARTLSQATEEIMVWLEVHRLLNPAHDVLDLGCGIGRIAQAIAPRVRTVTGIDISAGMLAEARRRLSCLPNAWLIQTGGADLPLVAQSMDLVLAADTFPYIILAGLAEATIAEIARVLRPGGYLSILNLSYGGLKTDRADARRWAAAHGLTVLENGTTPFRLWDGACFLMRAG